jgi:hypothetical protein
VGSRSRARTAGAATGSVAQTGTAAAGDAAQRAGVALQRGGNALSERSAVVGPAVAGAVEGAIDTVADVAGSVAGTVGGLLAEPGVRGGAALDALRGVPVGPPAAVRRWPWAVAAAVLGAAAGAGVALLAARLQGRDAPGAQEPHELRAVVDLPADPPAAAASPDAVVTPVPGPPQG